MYFIGYDVKSQDNSVILFQSRIDPLIRSTLPKLEYLYNNIY